MSEVKKRDLTMVPFELLVTREGFNVREDMGNIDELAASIKENGVKVPLRGYKEKGADKFYITDGHRRYSACALVVKQTGQSILVPFVLEPQGYNDEQRVLDMFITNEGKPLTPLEQSEGIHRLKNWGYSDADISKKIGKSTVYVWKLSYLYSAPKKLKTLIKEGKVSASLAMDFISKGEGESFLQAIESGKYESKENGNDLFPKEKSKDKITRKDIQPINSFKVFKKVARDIDEKQLDSDKAKFFKWLCRMMNNELTEESIKRFFK